MGLGPSHRAASTSVVTLLGKTSLPQPKDKFLLESTRTSDGKEQHKT